jgi:very-short-patch-repair endonuclease
VRHRPAAGATRRARALRTNATDAERRLWSVLRGGHIDGHKFRRQVPIGRYIADFVCADHKLIVEADGGHHSVEADAARTQFLESQGYCVMRFWNPEILANTDGVVRAIAAQLSQGPRHAV